MSKRAFFISWKSMVWVLYFIKSMQVVKNSNAVKKNAFKKHKKPSRNLLIPFLKWFSAFLSFACSSSFSLHGFELCCEEEEKKRFFFCLVQFHYFRWRRKHFFDKTFAEVWRIINTPEPPNLLLLNICIDCYHCFFSFGHTLKGDLNQRN